MNTVLDRALLISTFIFGWTLFDFSPFAVNFKEAAIAAIICFAVVYVFEFIRTKIGI